MAPTKDLNWKKQYLTAVQKNRDWRDLYALISGRKGRPPLNFIKEELQGNSDRITSGLKYFLSQEVNPSSSRDNIVFEDCSSITWNKEKKTDVTAPFLVNKLQLMTGMESSLAWEVLSNYLQFAFRGPPDSLQKLLAQNEEKAEAVIADLFCFYYRERMFILKILYHILTNDTGDIYSGVFCSFIKENIQYNELYTSLFNQLKTTSKAHPPNLSCLSHLSASRYSTFWVEHNLREQVQLIKLMIITLRNCSRSLPSLTSIKDLLQLLEESKMSERELAHRAKEHYYKILHRLYVVHFIQLIGFDTLSAEDARWTEDTRDIFVSVNEKVKLLMDRKSEEGPALLSTWFLVHSLTPLGTLSQMMREYIAHTVKTSNAWKYFINILVCQDVLDDSKMSVAVHHAVYQVAFLSVVNFGLEYVRCDDFYRLTALLVRDAQVLKHFWLTEADGLQLVLKECEGYFPVIWKPVFDIYTSIASHSEFYVNEVEKRVEKKVKYTQLQTKVFNMESLGNNVFRSLEAVQPFIASEKIVIPEGTRCVISGDKDIFIHWDFSVSIWHVIKEILFKWSQKMTEYPRPSEHELHSLRQNVLSTLAFYDEVLKNRKEQKKIVFFAVDEMFTRMELYHERKDAEMLNACLRTCTLLLKYYPKDVVMLLEVSRVIPDIDKVVLDHIQCAKGDFYHSNGIKTVLEIVELNSGKFTVLVSYLEFILELFSLPTVFELWSALAGLQFVLRDVFPHYNQWIFSDERQRIHIEWLCVQIISCALNVSLEEIFPAQKSVIKQVDDKGTKTLSCILPTKNLFANTALHHLLNWEPAIALIHIVSIGDQQLFSWVESFHNWDAKCCVELITSVHCALSILNKCILFKKVHINKDCLTRLEKEIYKEPKETDTYRAVINVAGYIYTFLSPDVRYNSVKLMSRFADNRHQSLMACIGMEANTMRQMYLKPLYSSTESEEIKVAVLELVTECIHKQASLAEAFLNALELKECVTKEEGEESEGFVHVALSIIRKRKETPTDRAFLASVQLLQALWHERRTLVISYIRMRENFFINFCYPLFHITEQQKKVVPAYAYILTCLGTEMYWHKDNVHSALKKAVTDLIENGYLVRLSLYCTDQRQGNSPEDNGDTAPTHTADSTKILIAWKEFVYVVVKSFPEEVKKAKDMQHILCVHTLNALANEFSRLGNMLAVSSLAELYLLLVTTWQLKRTTDQNLVALKKISAILTQLFYHYNLCSESAILNILASCCKFFEPLNLTDHLDTISDWKLHIERVIRAVCSLLTKELESLMDGNSNQSKQVLAPLLCLGITLGQVVGGECVVLWRDVVTKYHITSQLIEAVTNALQKKDMSDSTLLMLEFLTLLTRDDEWSFRQTDILELHSAWDSLKPPIQKLFGPMPVCLEEKSLFEATNWFPVYMRALNLVTALVSHPCPSTRELGFDFVYQHEKFICDIFEFKEDSLKETALDLVSSALRLLWHTIQALSSVPWNWKLKTTLGRTHEKVKLYLSVLVDLLGDPDLLLKRKILSQNQKMFSIPEMKTKETLAELHQLQNRLMGMMAEIICILKESCPLHTDLLTADRVGLPLYKLGLLLEPRPPAETGPQYHTLINLINLIAKRLASNIRSSPRTSSTSSSFNTANKLNSATSKAKSDENNTLGIDSPQKATGREDSFYVTKLSACSPDEMKLVLELSVHYMIGNTLLTILSDQMGFHHSITFLRDLSAEAKTFLEYTQRLRYGKEDIYDWAQQIKEPKNSRPLTWNSRNQNNMEDSVSLGCALLPEADSDDSSSSQRSPPLQSSLSEKHRKKLKVSQLRLPENLLHFLPSAMQFDLSFEQKNKDTMNVNFTNFSEDEDVTAEFILFCNHFLKQIFGMHGFSDRSLRGGL